MLLQTKRGGHKLHILDNVISRFEQRLSQYLLRRPKSDVTRFLRECTSSYNNTTNSTTRLTPKDANNSLLDPILRSRSEEPLEPFDEFVTRMLRLQKQAHQPSKVPNTDSNWRKWKINDLVILDFPKTLR